MKRGFNTKLANTEVEYSYILMKQNAPYKQFREDQI